MVFIIVYLFMNSKNQILSNYIIEEKRGWAHGFWRSSCMIFLVGYDGNETMKLGKNIEKRFLRGNTNSVKISFKKLYFMTLVFIIIFV